MINKDFSLRRVEVTRYITPLREGGSLPALAEANDGFKYVLKFRGAGHGVKMLIAEVLGGLIAQELGMAVPELVFADLDEAFGRTEADEEIQDLLQFSKGLNMALHFLSGALTYDPAAEEVEAMLASKIVWLDAYITNVDRTFRNTNMLMWHKELWLIDHGAAFYFHHSFTNWEKSALTPFPFIKDHVLLHQAKHLDEVNKQFKAMLTDEVLRAIVAVLPLEWLDWEESDLEPEEIRTIYFGFLKSRRDHADIFTNEANKWRNGGL